MTRFKAAISCPISMAIFRDPVTLPTSGWTVERDMAKKLVKDPFTSTRFTYSSELKTNYRMKDIIEAYLEAHPEAVAEQFFATPGAGVAAAGGLVSSTACCVPQQRR